MNKLNMDKQKYERMQLLGGKKEELKVRSIHNPYLKKVVAEYEAMDSHNRKIGQDLNDAFKILESHIIFLQKTHADERDILEKLENDLAKIINIDIGLK
tara:strand:- start:625 stop:921 length:297 start_codon:yes stop_codon:yes gene_type:complete